MNTTTNKVTNKARAYKRAPALSNSTWFKGFLISQMVGTTDSDGAFDTIIGKMKAGTEPPPHIHSKDDEFFYILSGELTVYADGEVFTATAGECVFLPRQKPHAFLVASDEIHMMDTLTPGGFFEAISKTNVPAERMEVPTDAESAAFGSPDLAETMKVFEENGIRFLTPDEIRKEMPQYPLPPA
ncbi:cupin domain-containing protein [Granulicella sp. dw_53]|uniref:cupin domain-containing protein n=1 Tax=Granulicella sp. dw_53 TaxID=2719792 RepID=UPI001BD655BF|nr:cupin domain-containing protein [Granulicella sp. dw_53]